MTLNVDASRSVWVAGGSGLVGSAVVRRLRTQDADLIATNSRDLDLRDRAATSQFVRRTRPAAVILCAARVGGIGANTTSPISMLSDNVQIGTSVLDACAENRVPKVVVVASAAMYPAQAQQPIRETSLWCGPAEPAHEAYAMAKLTAVAHVRAIYRELGLPYVVLSPCNIYGVNDNFHSHDSHVIPALLRKFWEAKESNASHVDVWGSGKARREFINSDDLASAVETVLESPHSDLPYNVGTGDDLTIREVVETVADVVGYTGDIVWETERPEGPSRRLIDSSKLRSLGWQPEVTLRDGLTAVHDWLAGELAGEGVRGWERSIVVAN